MKKQILLFAITICAIGCTKDANFTDMPTDFQNNFPTNNITKTSYDWRNDEVLTWATTNAIKFEILLHLTVDSQAVLRITNLQSCNTDIIIWANNGSVKNFDAGEIDTVRLTGGGPGGQNLVGVAPWLACSPDADTEISSFFFNINDCLPAEVSLIDELRNKVKNKHKKEIGTKFVFM